MHLRPQSIANFHMGINLYFGTDLRMLYQFYGDNFAGIHNLALNFVSPSWEQNRVT